MMHRVVGRPGLGVTPITSGCFPHRGGLIVGVLNLGKACRLLADPVKYRLFKSKLLPFQILGHRHTPGTVWRAIRDR